MSADDQDNFVVQVRQCLEGSVRKNNLHDEATLLGSKLMRFAIEWLKAHMKYQIVQ